MQSNTTEFKNSMKTVEKVSYKGELRIVGQIVERLDDKEPIGYVVMVEKTNKMKAYNIAQTIALLSRFSFVNAEIENGKIVNTECAMQRLPKFNTTLSVIGNLGVTILGVITNGNEKIGYRAMDCNAKIVDISEDELIKLTDNGIGLINAKVVTQSKTSKRSISAIKSEFTKIEKSKLPEIITKDNPRVVWRKSKHVDKLNRLYPLLVRQGFKGSTNVNDCFFRRLPDSKGGWSYMNLESEFKIAFKEIFTQQNGYTLTQKDKELALKIKEMPHNKDEVVRNLSSDDRVFMLAIAQFSLCNENKYKSTFGNVLRTHKFNNKPIEYLIKTGYACDKLIKLNKELKDTFQKYSIRQSNLEKTQMSKEFKTTKFTTAEEMAQLGFTISSADSGDEVRTKAGFHKTLKYLGNFFANYDEYTALKSRSRCLGDLLAVADISKILSKLRGNTPYYGVSREDMIASIEIIIIISYMYNSEAMKYYVESIANEELARLGIEVNYDDIAGVDYKLPSEIALYYTSGFNVFLKDNKEYKKAYLEKAKLINYRQIGVSYNINHEMLSDILAPTVAMLSNQLDVETIARLIGKIRFI